MNKRQIKAEIKKLQTALKGLYPYGSEAFRLEQKIHCHYLALRF